MKSCANRADTDACPRKILTDHCTRYGFSGTLRTAMGGFGGKS
ncbi:hypothetical protein [Desulfonema ishimotonii]|nr:hypothetical protein [Desulfonema ishimotonii]